jgi:hypothetical protein
MEAMVSLWQDKAATVYLLCENGRLHGIEKNADDDGL